MSANVVERNKFDSIEFAKQRRAKTLIAREKRAQKAELEANCFSQQNQYSHDLATVLGGFPMVAQKEREKTMDSLNGASSRCFTDRFQDHAHLRQIVPGYDSLAVRERADIRKRQEEEQYEEALRQARITANAERRLAAERALARMSESDEKPLGHTVQVAIPTRNHPPHPGLAVGAGNGAGRRAKSQNPFGATWNDSIGGGGWSMLSSNLIDDQPPAFRKGSARSRSHGGVSNADERVVADSPQNLQHAMRERQQQAKRRDEELYEASLLRARQEAAAERKRLAEQQHHHHLTILSNAEPAIPHASARMHKTFRDEPEEFKNSFIFESFQKSRAASAGSTDTNNKASSKASSKDSRSGLIFVQLEPPRREKPHLSSQRRCSSVQGEGDEEQEAGGEVPITCNPSAQQATKKHNQLRQQSSREQQQQQQLEQQHLEQQQLEQAQAQKHQTRRAQWGAPQPLLLQVRTLEDAHGQVQVENLAEIEVESLEEAMRAIESGQRARVTHANAVHADSSRSHAVLQALFRCTREQEAGPPVVGVAGYHTASQHYQQSRLLGKVVLVDLAGSERASETLSDDKATRHEGAEINKSLLALKECVRALGRGDKHKQFRGSKLTQVLRDGLVGRNSRAVMIAALSPASGSTEHTLNTLRYADRLKEIGLKRI